MNPEPQEALTLYRRCISGGVVEYLQKQAGLKIRRSIYTSEVVIWLMIWQRLQPSGTLSTAVAALLAGAADWLLSSCERAQRKRISSRTGGLSHARQRLPKLLCKQVVEELTMRLREIVAPDSGRPAYVLDGSSLELEASSELRKRYPPAQNQHGQAHWPILRIVVMHELETGVAEKPQWGPMYGPKAVSEQELADAAMDTLTPDSIVVGDRNFGVFTTVWKARQRGLDVVIRLTKERAEKIVGGPIATEGEWRVRWKASRFDGRKQGGLPAEACVEGRLIAQRIGRGKSKEWLYLFDTLSLPRQEVAALYGKRWHIETDLRSLKRTVRLHHVSARSESMMEKEILTATAAYNLVRAVIALAARRYNLSPRQLSFTFVLNHVNAQWPKLQAAPNQAAHLEAVLRLLDIAIEGVLPRRKKHRSYPRAVWHRRHSFPARGEDKP